MLHTSLALPPQAASHVPIRAPQQVTARFFLADGVLADICSSCTPNTMRIVAACVGVVLQLGGGAAVMLLQVRALPD